jgi:hypothetical protein
VAERNEADNKAGDFRTHNQSGGCPVNSKPSLSKHHDTIRVACCLRGKRAGHFTLQTQLKPAAFPRKLAVFLAK